MDISSKYHYLYQYMQHFKCCMGSVVAASAVAAAAATAATAEAKAEAAAGVAPETSSSN